MDFHWWEKHIADLSIGDYLADHVTKLTGAFSTFCIAVLIVVIWGILGPHYNYSDTWQLVINTGTTIVTFLMCFLIQNNQNRQASRDRHQADADYQTNLAAKEEIEALQIAIARIETEKLEILNGKLDKLVEHSEGLHERVKKTEGDIRMMEYRRNLEAK